MNATIRWSGAVRFEVDAGSGATLTTDGPPDSGGVGAGARPMELVLAGAGACASYDVVHILRKGRHDITDCVCTLEAERAPEPPRVFTEVAMHFVVTGRALKPGAVARAVQLSAEKYCSASIMLARAGVKISHTHEVVSLPPAEAP
jgi:putative redox protein